MTSPVSQTTNQISVADLIEAVTRHAGLPADQPIRHLEIVVPLDGFVTVRVHLAGMGLPIEIPATSAYGDMDVILGQTR
jgi:hypothetical protein